MTDEEETVILVDTDDQPIGEAGKLCVHRTGALHRAFSVFGFNASGDLLLQKRAMCKYHSPGLWANMCCGHPRPGEDTLKAARRRTSEEVGVSPVLEYGFSALYTAAVGKGLIEHEYVHVYACRLEVLPEPDPEEASAVRFVSLEQILRDLQNTPDIYAGWFRIYMAEHLLKIRQMATRLCPSGQV